MGRFTNGLVSGFIAGCVLTGACSDPKIRNTLVQLTAEKMQGNQSANSIPKSEPSSQSIQSPGIPTQPPASTSPQHHNQAHNTVKKYFGYLMERDYERSFNLLDDSWKKNLTSKEYEDYWDDWEIQGFPAIRTINEEGTLKAIVDFQGAYCQRPMQYQQMKLTMIFDENHNQWLIGNAEAKGPGECPH